MGWTFTRKSRDESTIEFLKRTSLTWNVPAEQHPQIVDATAGFDHAVFAIRFPAEYIAARGAIFSEYVPDADGSVTGALVFLVKHQPRARDGLNFGYKDCGETGGPYFTACSARILAKLSTINPGAGSGAEWALKWRAAVQERAQAPKLASIKAGALVKLAQAVRFTDGTELQEFRAFKRGAFTGKRGAKKWNPNAGAVRFTAQGGTYRLSNAHLQGATITEA